MRPPDLGPANVSTWQAWRRDLTDVERAKFPSQVATWWVHAPGAHLLWDWHLVLVCHLRDVRGTPPASLTRPGATHELVIMARDPDRGIPDIDGPVGDLGMLSPPNMVHQIVDVNDEQAAELAMLLVRGFVRGATSPDEDWRHHNAKLLDDAADLMRSGRWAPS